MNGFSLTRKYLLGATAVVLVGLSINYADMLKAAFVQNLIKSSPDSIARGRDIFEKNCVVCHGPEGRGDGIAAGSLPERPEDLSTIAPPPIFPDGVVAYLIANGVNAMPAWKTVLNRKPNLGRTQLYPFTSFETE